MNLIKNLSNHLFWDIDASDLDTEVHSNQIISRVLRYGLYEDWLILRKYYGLDRIVEAAVSFKNLDKKTASFLSLIADIPKDSFLCYTTKQSIPKHWNF
jgi:hypothetical protein